MDTGKAKPIVKTRLEEPFFQAGEKSDTEAEPIIKTRIVENTFDEPDSSPSPSGPGIKTRQAPPLYEEEENDGKEAAPIIKTRSEAPFIEPSEPSEPVGPGIKTRTVDPAFIEPSEEELSSAPKKPIVKTRAEAPYQEEVETAPSGPAIKTRQSELSFEAPEEKGPPPAPIVKTRPSEPYGEEPKKNVETSTVKTREPEPYYEDLQSANEQAEPPIKTRETVTFQDEAPTKKKDEQSESTDPNGGYDQALKSGNSSDGKPSRFIARENANKYSKYTGDPLDKEVACYECGVIHGVVKDATSSLCPNCGTYISLKNHTIDNHWNSSIRTRGNVNIQKRGKLINLQITCNDLILEGTFHSSADCSNDFIVKSSGTITGDVNCKRLIIDKKVHAVFERPVFTTEVIVSGELHANIECHGQITLNKKAKLKGDLKTKLISIQEGAIHEGSMQLG